MMIPATRHNLSNMQHLSLEFSVAENVQSGDALVWLEVLDDVLAVSTVRAVEIVPDSIGQQWLEVVLGVFHSSFTGSAYSDLRRCEDTIMLTKAWCRQEMEGHM